MLGGLKFKHILRSCDMIIYLLQTFPVVYALMSNRSTVLYNKLFEFLIDNFGLHPRSIMCDFETALQSSLEHSLPQATLKGCLFHYMQVCGCCRTWQGESAHVN